MYPPRPLHCVALVLLGLAICCQAFGQPPERRGDRPDRKKILKRYDKDGDGRLNQAERNVLRADVLSGRFELPAGVRERFKRMQAEKRPGPRMPESVVVERDVQYGKAGERPLKLDIVRPKQSSTSPRPVIVYVHGGGWRGGNKSGGVRRLVPFAASGNYFCASVGYRLTGEAIWPAQINDCKAAIRFLKARAKQYNIDPKRIGVWGSSAGGHLVSLLGTSGDVKELEGSGGSPGQSSRVACVVDFCGPSDFLAFGKTARSNSPNSPLVLLFGGPVDENKEAARAASPLTHVSADDPPFLIAHGTEDKTVPLAQAELLHAALKKVGVDSTFVKIQGGGHGIRGEQIAERVAAFFDKHLRGKALDVSSSPIDATAGGR